MAASILACATSSSSEEDWGIAELRCELWTEIASWADEAWKLSGSRPEEECTETTGGDAKDGWPSLDATPSPVKSTTGATIWTELPEVSVMYSVVLCSDSILTKFGAKSLKGV
jgi:hypothetical protein